MVMKDFTEKSCPFCNFEDEWPQWGSDGWSKHSKALWSLHALVPLVFMTEWLGNDRFASKASGRKVLFLFNCFII